MHIKMSSHRELLQPVVNTPEAVTSAWYSEWDSGWHDTTQSQKCPDLCYRKMTDQHRSMPLDEIWIDVLISSVLQEND